MNGDRKGQKDEPVFKQQTEDMEEIKMGTCPLLNGPEKI